MDLKDFIDECMYFQVRGAKGKKPSFRSLNLLSENNTLYIPGNDLLKYEIDNQTRKIVAKPTDKFNTLPSEVINNINIKEPIYLFTPETCKSESYDIKKFNYFDSQLSKKHKVKTKITCYLRGIEMNELIFPSDANWRSDNVYRITESTINRLHGRIPNNVTFHDNSVCVYYCNKPITLNKTEVQFLISDSQDPNLISIMRDCTLYLVIFRNLSEPIKYSLKNVDVRFSFDNIAKFFSTDDSIKRFHQKLTFGQILMAYFTFKNNINAKSPLDNPTLLAKNIPKEIYNTYAYLMNHPDMKHASEEISRYGHYFLSRNNLFRNILYWFNGGYYKLLWPIILFFVLITVIFLMINFCLPFYPLENHAKDLLNPLDMMRKIVLDGFSFNSSISIPKIVLFLCLLVIPYPLFCIAAAIKKRWGFPKRPFGGA